MEELKPCPFCGGEAKVHIIDVDGDNFGGHYVECCKCGYSTNLRFNNGEDPMPIQIEQWNKRVGT